MKRSICFICAVAIIVSSGSMSLVVADKDLTFFRDEETKLAFPKKLGEFSCLASRRFDDKDLGFGIKLTLPDSDALVHLYVYDLGKKDIPSDLKSSIVREHFATVKTDVTNNAKNGTWKSVQHVSDATVPLTKEKGASRMLCATYLVETPAKEKSSVYLGVERTKFVKIRTTYPRSDANRFEKEFEQLLRELATVLRSK